MDLENILAAGHGRSVDVDMSVESSRTHQGLVEDIWPVGAGEDDYLLRGVETIHLREDLVESRLALVVTATTETAVRTGPSNGVDFVDKDDARRVLARRREQITDAGRTHTDKHLHKLGAADSEEGNLRLAGGGLGEQRLTSTGRTRENSTAGNLGT